MFNLEFFPFKLYLFMKNLTDLRKKLETGVNLRLSYAVASSDLMVKVIMCPLFLSTSDCVKERYCHR